MTEVLTFLPYYLPGYTSGGPIRTIANLVEQLGDEFQFKIITSHADPRDPAAYREVRVDAFQRVGKAHVYYASAETLSLGGLRALINRASHDILYLNSFFAPDFTFKPLLLRRLNLIPDRPVIIAPRGEFSPNALSIKRLKKVPYLVSAKVSGLYEDVIWQVSSPYEATQVHEQFGDRSRVVVAPDVPGAVPSLKVPSESEAKNAGALDVVFLSRVARMKNLDGALRILSGMQERIHFDIYGPIEDEPYWAECQRLIDDLPDNVVVQYRGAVPPGEVRSVMSRYHLFFLPTRGENFGHAIQEALSVGVPVLISDLTPWRDLNQKKAGWDVPLADVQRYRTLLKKCAAMGAREYEKWSAGARNYALTTARDDDVLEQNRILFNSVAHDNRAIA